MSETKRLGRGLEALLGSVSREQAQASGALAGAPGQYQCYRTRISRGPR